MEPLAIIAMSFGVVAALSFFLQTLKIVRLRESKGISLPTYIILFFTTFFWLLYGFSIGDTPLMVSYTVGIFSITSIIIVTLKYRKGGKPKSPSKP